MPSLDQYVDALTRLRQAQPNKSPNLAVIDRALVPLSQCQRALDSVLGEMTLRDACKTWPVGTSLRDGLASVRRALPDKNPGLLTVDLALIPLEAGIRALDEVVDGFSLRSLAESLVQPAMC